MDKIEIVKADMGNAFHAAAVVEMVDSYASDPMGGGNGLSKTAKENLPSGLSAFPTAHVFIGFLGDQAIAAAICFLGYSTFQAKPLMNVHDMIVKNGFRGKGVGKQVLEAVEAKAAELGCCKMTLEVREDNGRAKGLYSSFGFRNMDFGGAENRVTFMEKKMA